MHSLTENKAISQKIDQRGVLFTCVDVIQEMEVVVFGTNRGSVRVYLWPWDPLEQYAPEFTELALCTGSITALTHSLDHSFLFVGGEDGQIFFVSLAEVREGAEMENLYDYRRHANLMSIYCLNELSLSSGAH